MDGWMHGQTDGWMDEYFMIYCLKIICKTNLSLDPNSSRAQAIVYSTADRIRSTQTVAVTPY